MKYAACLLNLLLLIPYQTMAAEKTQQLLSKSNGISYPVGWQNWSTISVSQRTDNNTLRLIVGNAIAVKAARAGRTNPWPENSIIGKVVWKDEQLSTWPTATKPGKLIHAEFMFKESNKFVETYGWGWARWVGKQQRPFNNGMQQCITCHTPVKENDWVFTEPASLP